MVRLSAAEIRGLRAKRKAALKAKGKMKRSKARQVRQALTRAGVAGEERSRIVESLQRAKKTKQASGPQAERKRVMATVHETGKPLTATGAKSGEDVSRTKAPNIGQPEIRMKEAPEKRTELGKGMADHVQGILKKHESADPTLPSPTEVAVRALGLRCLQLLAEAEAIAAQIELYEVPEEDEEKRAEAKECSRQKRPGAKVEAEGKGARCDGERGNGCKGRR